MTKVVLLIFLVSVAAAVVSKINEEYFENFYNEIDANDENPQGRNALRWDIQRWPNKTVPFRISPEYTGIEADTIRKALQVFKDKTCVKFVEFEDDKPDDGKRFLYFEKRENYCGTKVGYQPIDSDRHNLFLSSSCSLLPGAVQHEVLHVLGLYHEQSRSDRDNYIDVDWDNIPTKNWHNFIKVPDIYASTYGNAYDFGSIMHYSGYAFAKDRKRPSMTVKKGQINPYQQMGQLISPSLGDLNKVNRMYDCIQFVDRF